MTDGKWQPIETAPKDGATPVLVSVRTPFGVQMRVAQIVYWSGEKGDQRGQWCMAVFRGFIGLEYHPTHWMPLPAPPQDYDR